MINGSDYKLIEVADSRSAVSCWQATRNRARHMWATGTALCDDIAGFDAESGSESSHVAFKNLLLYVRTLGHCHWQRRMPNCRRKI